MKKITLLFGLVLMMSANAFAQEDKGSFFSKHPFVNKTEFGGLFGRVRIPSTYYYYYPSSSSYWPPYPSNVTYTLKNVANISIQTFNGIYLNPKTAVGITLGADWYSGALVTPISAGLRRTLAVKKQGGSALVAGLDAGWGTTWLHEDNPNQKTSAGLMVNPTIGFKFPMRNGSAWLLNFGYKYQQVEVKDIITEENIYNISGLETRNYNRVQMRLGFEF
jgi:hypothetical protein